MSVVDFNISTACWFAYRPTPNVFILSDMVGWGHMIYMIYVCGHACLSLCEVKNRSASDINAQRFKNSATCPFIHTACSENVPLNLFKTCLSNSWSPSGLIICNRSIFELDRLSLNKQRNCQNCCCYVLSATADLIVVLSFRQSSKFIWMPCIVLN